MEKRIAVGVNKEGTVWEGHFGMSPQYYIYDASGSRVETRTNPHGVDQPEEKEHGSPQETLDLLADCKVFIASVTGYYIVQVQRSGVEVVTTTATDPDAAVTAYLEAS